MFYGVRLSHRLRDRHLTNVTDDNVRIALGMLFLWLLPRKLEYQRLLNILLSK